MRRAVRIEDDMPDYAVRSALVVECGLWQMRNGHIARVEKRIDIPYESGGKACLFPVWKGRCLECNDPLTWNINGTYAAIGKHPFDLVRPAPAAQVAA